MSVSTGNPVISLAGEIDLATAGAMASALGPWLRAGGPLTLDLSEVTFMDSTGLHALVRAAATLGGRGCIIVHGAHGSVETLLDLTNVERAAENLHFIECEVLAPV